MAIEKVGVYRKWLEPRPQADGIPIPKSMWPKCRRHRCVVRWFGTDNSRYGKVFETRKEADKYARQLQVLVENGKQDKLQKITLHEFIVEHEKVMKSQVAQGTIVDQMRALKFFEKFVGSNKLLAKITPRDAEAFIADRLAGELSIASANKDIRTLKRIFNLAIEPRGYLREGQNPFGKIKQRKYAAKDIRYVSVGEYKSLINATETDTWWKAFIAVAYGSGLRRGEILNLTWADIDFERCLIRIRSKEDTAITIQWEPKDHENRVVPMPNEVSQLLADIQVQAPDGFPYIFIDPERLAQIRLRQKLGTWKGNSEVVNNIAKNFNSLCRRAKVSRHSVHDLRRSAITNWAQQMPIQVVQQLAGHSDIKTTRKYYLSVRPDDIAAANKFMNGILAGAKSE